MDEQDPKRHDMQPPIPARPPEPASQKDAEKVVGGPSLAGHDPNEPPLVNTGISSGAPLDEVGGAGLGKPPGEGNAGSVSGSQAQTRQAADPQDRRDQT